jgi:ABC-type transport system substrate-binding protein
VRPNITRAATRSPVRHGAVLAAIPISTLGLAGCNFNPSGAAETGATTLTVAACGPSLGFAPVNSQPGYFDQLLQPIYDPLFQLNAAGEPVPNIATKWKYDSSFTTLTIDIRDGVKFTDGSKLDAEAVTESLEHIQGGNFNRGRATRVDPEHPRREPDPVRLAERRARLRVIEAARAAKDIPASD